jgi:hypothetical protein
LDTKVAILLILFLVCVIYSIVLEYNHDRYVPRYLWLTVVIGNGFVFGALWLMEAFGVRLDAMTILEANIAAGLPVIAWQLHQNHRRTKELRQP